MPPRLLPDLSRSAWRAWVLALALLAGCYGDDVTRPQPAAACDLASQKAWLRDYMREWYLWAGRAPDPEPGADATLAQYFEALRFRGDASTPADVWSYYQDSASYQQFFGEGRTLGYGLFVNGVERTLPLRVRMVEPQGPAALAGLQRGDRIVALNGVPDSSLITGDFALLSPAQPGERLTVELENDAGRRTLELVAAVYDLTPVPVARVLALPDGRRVGYLALKDFIVQAEAPVAAAFEAMRAQGAGELIVDLRYNGGGRISTARQLASQVVGAARAGEVFVALRHNAAHRDVDLVLRYLRAPAPSFRRVLVLTGSRTCSASELIVNGLAPQVEVVTLGGRTCGKPYGFDPIASCGNTFNVVNFDSVNAAGQGGYVDGLAPTCAVAEDFTGALGDPAERLTGAALAYLQTGQCPAAAAPLRALQPLRPARPEPGERPGMRLD